MPNKMTTTKLSLAAAALLALAYPAWGAQPKKWECEHEDIEELHTIEVTYKEPGQDLPAYRQILEKRRDAKTVLLHGKMPAIARRRPKNSSPITRRRVITRARSSSTARDRGRRAGRGVIK